MKTDDTNKKNLVDETENPQNASAERKLNEKELEQDQAQFFSIFDQMPAEVSVIDPHTYETLFMNRYARDLYGHDIGRLCYDIFHGYNAPCRFCNNELLLASNDGESVRREFFSERVGRHYLSTNNLIRWPDGRRVKLEIAIDITDKKQTDKALKDSELKYRFLMDSMADIVFMLNINLAVTYVSPSIEHILGFTSEEWKILGLEGQFTPKTRKMLSENLLMEFESRNEQNSDPDRSFTVEFECYHKDRSVKYLETHVLGLRDSNGKLTGIYGLQHDVTERRNTEEQLRESEQKYRDLTDLLPQVIYEVDLNGNLTFVNQMGYKIFGYIPGTPLKNKNMLDLIAPQDRALATERAACIMSGKQGKGTELSALRADGSSFPAIIYSGPIFRDEKVVGMRGTLIDITDLKNIEKALRESEEWHRTIFNHSNDVIYSVSLDYRITSMSPSVERFLGYKPEEFIGRYLGEIHIMPQEYLDRAFKEMNEVFAGKHFRASEYVFITNDGRRVIGEVSAAPLVKEGVVAGLIAVGRDITERKQAETEKRILEERLRHTDKMDAIGTLAGGIAHDFNNLLMGIQGCASLSLIDLDSLSPHYERLKRIEEQVRSGADLTRQLLGFARGGRYEVKPTDMNDVLKISSSMFGRTKKEISIYQKYEKNLWSTDVDRGQMEQVLMNLYVNAWQAMPGGGELYLETENILLDDEQAISCSVRPGEYVKISVTDTGTGMDDKTKERIFDPFFTTKGMGRGTGLGLATVYGIVKGHKGMIHVDSEPGHGTTFKIYLPASGRKVIGENMDTASVATGTETILLVDDEKIVLEVNKELLGSLGYRIYPVSSGQEALAVYMEKQKEINLVILDMIMPGISGSETFDRLREINPDAKVLLSSGYSINSEAKYILDRGCNGFIQKPFQLQKLSQKIREMMD